MTTEFEPTPKAGLPALDLAAFRQFFPVLATRAYLFSGSLTPAATPVRAAWDAWAEAWSSDPNKVMTEAAMLGEMAALRAAFAGLIGATPSEIALTDNTSRAANTAVRILATEPSGDVLVDDTSYPSSVYPWRAAGREVRYVPTDTANDPTEALAGAIDDQTLAVCISHVAPFSGRRHDLAAISRTAHAHGAALMVDAAQAAGAVPINVSEDGVDVLVTTSMKWLLGPPGMGFFYVNRRLLSRAPVLDVGYIGLDVPLGDWPVTTFPPVSQDARRYELGLPALPGIAAARIGIELLMRVGIERVFARIEELATQCIEGLAQLGQTVLTPRDPERRAGVIVFPDPRPHELFGACRDQRVDIGVLGPWGQKWGQRVRIPVCDPGRCWTPEFWSLGDSLRTRFR
jgi:selenocysteine lyase/cysteine desulfurase